MTILRWYWLWLHGDYDDDDVGDNAKYDYDDDDGDLDDDRYADHDDLMTLDFTFYDPSLLSQRKLCIFKAKMNVYLTLVDWQVWL